ncbi:hypothetical protein PVAP13_5KG543200, partial [Panicum virgatum]
QTPQKLQEKKDRPSFGRERDLSPSTRAPPPSRQAHHGCRVYWHLSPLLPCPATTEQNTAPAAEMAAAAAAAAAARSFLRSSPPSSLRSAAARAASRAGPAPLPRRMPTSAPRVLLRSPVEMSSVCLESLMPMHSATASALMTSLLAAPACKGFGWLLEGQDETR